ncbi:S-adenosyl-L-methionine-dependent methyltransferase [Cyathus striatus]|nr:S-adenosyl-L-methionine-dependent methyltransferase [Cyathus striatus]
MKLGDIYDLLVGRLGDFFYAGTWPTLKAILRNPTLLFRPTAISKEFMFHVWNMGLLTPHANGIVLDMVLVRLWVYRHGHTVHYLQHDKVTKYVALEPNMLMHGQIREHASKAGFNESDGSLIILPYGAENTSAILSALGGAQVDTIISILTLCSVPSPEKTINAVVRDLLHPGGQLLFREHVLSDHPDVAWWQRFLTPLWKIPLDGCRLDRPTHIWIEKMGVGDANGVWKEGRVWSTDGEPDDGLLWHRIGRYVKR